MPVGTQDFYFEVAQKLDNLNVEFLILVRDSQQKAVSVITNTADGTSIRMFARAAGNLAASLDDTEQDP